jgi:8-oxo-dGTP diphosphatase
MSFQDTYRLSVHAVITNDEQQVLQIRATYDGGQWGLPGGSLEPGETVHKALVRECMEELGCEVEACYLNFDGKVKSVAFESVDVLPSVF